MTPLFLALALVAAPRAAVVVRVAGFGDDDVARLESKANAEVSATGVEVWALSSSLAVKAECLADRVCAREVLKTADAEWLVRIELTRAGGHVQIMSALIDKEGRVFADATAAARATAVLGAEPILPASVVSTLRSAAQVTPPAPDAPANPPANDGTSNPADAPADPALTPSNPPPKEGEALSGLAFAGIGGVAVGALATMVGAAGAAGQFGVARDPTAAGPDKERAAVLIPTLTAVGIGGVVVAGLSGWLLWSELAP